MMQNPSYDVIVIGAGHAGCEAALAAARMGCSTCIFAIDLDKLASMPCSPSIGGTAKGQLVKEVDALGGEMAKITDQTAIQYKTLNTKKGPAVWSTRTQNDKNRYHLAMKKVMEHCPNLAMRQALINEILVENGCIKGVFDHTGFFYATQTLILATGTFLSGTVHIGLKSIRAGRAGEFAAYELADNLKQLGLSLGRMKTGTPPRLKKSSIDFSKFKIHTADAEPRPFSFSSRTPSSLPQLPSWIGHTSLKNREIVLKNLDRSPLYSGVIQGVSARYCPSFEDKAVKFPERGSHQIILEPEGLDTDEIYASGLGNSLPMDVQIEFVRAVPGLEAAEIIRPGYAIEYDFVDPTQLAPTLETKKIRGLFLAGQINGTSGYEEAAAQGLWAGINAACRIKRLPPFLPDRSEAYMAVLVDDLVTRGTREPYRMFTSRAEYRLLLREDNADIRLAEKGYHLGLVKRESLERIREYVLKTDEEIRRIRSIHLGPATANPYLAGIPSPEIKNGTSLDQLLKRTELDYGCVHALAPPETPLGERVERQVEIAVKYEGYIARQLQEVTRFKDLEKIRIPPDFPYGNLPGLSNELRDKLRNVLPQTLGQASRMEGMTPAALALIRVVLKNIHSGNETGH